MKTWKFFFLFSFYLLQLPGSSTVFAQGFGSLGSEWHYIGHNAAPWEYSGYYRFASVADTLVKNQVAHKIVQQHYNYTGTLGQQSAGYFYEQSDTVFMYSQEQEKFLVFLIFNRQAGDTITLDAPEISSWSGPTYRLVIDAVTTVVIDSVPLKVYKTTPLDNYRLAGGGKFMDRIGVTGWFFPIGISGIPEGPGEIRCYEDSEIDTNFYTYSCDYTLSTATEDYSMEDRLELFPNPVTDMLTVKSSVTIDRIDLFDLGGRLRYSTRQQVIDVSGWSKGCYYLLAYLPSGRKVYRKVVKY